jgi:hypothetical protein
MEDKTLTCEECGQPFTLTPGDRQLYEGRGIEEPKICIECRRAHKDEKSEIIGEGEGGGVGGPFNL